MCPLSLRLSNMGPQLVLPTFESTVSSPATKITPVRTCGLKVCMAARGSFRRSSFTRLYSPSCWSRNSKSYERRMYTCAEKGRHG